jgi:Phospholipase B
MPSLFRHILIGLILLAAFGPRDHAGGPSADARAHVFHPDSFAVERHGPAYRYPQAGWIVLHIEGEPYERGFQHGRLMAGEIARFIGELAAYRSQRAPEDAWRDLRLIADALFLRRFDAEYLDEMKGIADGAAAAGAKFDGRAIDLLDVVTINADIETTFLDEALDATATGLEGRKFREPREQGPALPKESHCSAFAATGPATADGQVVIGHITMWNLFHAYHYNVWLDVKPARGHRVLMQTYPGGIMSGLDYYMNDRGMVMCETTLAQTRFDASGIPLADRIRRALQYGDSIDQAVAILRQGNNGLYTNEWLLADTKTNEIAMFELGTHQSKLWRSSKNEWFGGTAGFYWGCNNTKDLEVRLETVPAVDGRPANLVFHPSDRDRKWLELFDKKNRAIDADFGFMAFTTSPLAASHSLDAKFTTTAMARELATWAKFGPPLGRTWEPTGAERKRFPDMHSLVANDWTILRAVPPTGESIRPAKPIDLARVEREKTEPEPRQHAPAWHGTLLPATDADIWLTTAFADYEVLVARQKAGNRKPGARERERHDLDLFAPTSRYLAAVARRGGVDIALAEIRADFRSDEWYEIASGKGVLILAELRALMGGSRFDAFMDDFGRAHAGRPGSTAAFFDAAEKAQGKPLGDLRDAWLNGDALARLGADARSRKASGRFWSIDSFERQLDKTLIIYGTLAEADAQREAASSIQHKVASRWSNLLIPIKADTEVTDDELKAAHILVVGRPTTNRLTARLAKAFPVEFGEASFRVVGDTYAHPHSAIVAAGPSPWTASRSVVVFAGLSAEATWACPSWAVERGSGAAEIAVMADGTPVRRLAVPASKDAPGVAAVDSPQAR